MLTNWMAFFLLRDAQERERRDAITRALTFRLQAEWLEGGALPQVTLDGIESLISTMKAEFPAAEISAEADTFEAGVPVHHLTARTPRFDPVGPVWDDGLVNFSTEAGA